MPEPSGRELYDKWSEMRVDLAQINTKLDFLMELKRDVEKVDEKVAEVDTKANKALSMAEENKADIAEMKSGNQFRFNVVIGAILTITGFMVTIGIAIFT
ncbi:hypothetical protein GJU41_12075 [Bacillus idriensis]|uniref:Holin n=1 Tax=Metabacillus idriensis TaxID=324768 RepID=A0A6I2ME70_9BACI|nr:hypothetical protein [Metabacillus idriensis]MRX54711.1 hypothetical protein [Metabacillus idriensis]